jgi:D-3-phosphoglycerate dehydrogenase
MVSRINEFNKLWFEPTGHVVMFLYDDRPGVLGSIGVNLASRGVNIEDVRNPHDAETNHSLAIMKVNQRVPDDLIAHINRQIEALAAFSIKL